MTTTPRILTADDLWRMPNDQRRELVKGELFTMAPDGFDHGAVISNLHFLLMKHVKERRIGLILGAETGFLLARDPDTVRGADIAFVANERLPIGERPKGYFPGPPDLAVEVVSPGDTNTEVEDKVDDYLAAGTRLVWVVNPRRRTVTAYRPGAGPTMFRDTESLTADDILPGFACPVAEIFA